MTAKAGFSLIETIVALLLLQVGMLALAATAGVAARDYADAIARRRALAIADRRAGQLRSQACASPASGAQTLPSGAVESWHVAAVGVGREIVATVVVPLTRGRRATIESRGWVMCRA